MASRSWLSCLGIRVIKSDHRSYIRSARPPWVLLLLLLAAKRTVDGLLGPNRWEWELVKLSRSRSLYWILSHTGGSPRIDHVGAGRGAGRVWGKCLHH